MYYITIHLYISHVSVFHENISAINSLTSYILQFDSILSQFCLVASERKQKCSRYFLQYFPALFWDTLF